MSLPQVLLLESIPDAALNKLQAATQVWSAPAPDAGLPLAQQHDIQAIVTRGKGQVNAALLAACPRLKLVARCGVGLDNVDQATASQLGIMVLNTPGANADTVAEQALSMMLMLQRQLFQSVAEVKAGNWAFRSQYSGDEVRGKCLGILGMGNIGKRVAKLAQVFGMRVIYWDLFAQEVPHAFVSLDEIWIQSDLISLHLPLTSDTQYLIDAQVLSQLQPHALLINTARGGLIDQEALFQALQAGQLAGFAADVLATEPPLANEPLLTLPQVLITPHAASLTRTTYTEMCLQSVENVLAGLAGKAIDPFFIANRQTLSSPNS